MCGIAGVIHKDEKRRRAINKMVKVIVHRGPDEDGYFEDERIALGMRRLSIIDLSTGRQPIVSKDGKLVIIFNGEIYNYKELKEKLKILGKTFQTESDTEVILSMYEEYGYEAFGRLRGMFALAIYNKETGRTILARDFFGIKPLYYLRGREGVTAFASEMKSFLSISGFKPEVNDSAVFNYLSYQYNPLEETFFKDVYKLMPGHMMMVEANGSYEILRYFHYEIKPDEKLDEEETRKEILETMRDSVAHHMIADVPVGAFLSGGIDSSIIANLMQENRRAAEGSENSRALPISGLRRDENLSEPSSARTDRIKTFTVSFKTVPASTRKDSSTRGWSEGKEARETSDPLGTDHREISIGADEYFSVLPQAVWHFDEPVADPSAIGLYFLAREARKYVKVVLSGEGADELFGGYNIYLEPFARRRARLIPRPILRLLSKLPFRGKNFALRILTRLEDRYIGNAKIFSDTEVTRLWTGEKQEKFNLGELYSEARKLSDSSKMQYIDIHTWLVGDILAKADKMTMAHSLELRVPFLDRQVARLAHALPDRFKWRKVRGKVETKYLLREAFRGILPESVRVRPKLGFPTPVRDWFRSGRRDYSDTIFKNAYIKARFNLDEVKHLIRDHISGKADNSRKIYLLLMLALWYNRFIENK